jgi:Zinc carboxypeptidase
MLVLFHSDYKNLKSICEEAVAAIGKKHGKVYLSGSKYETIYPSSGGSIDWVYKANKIPISLTFELRGPPDSTNMFILPADEIIPTGEEILAAFIKILGAARDKGYYSN